MKFLQEILGRDKWCLTSEQVVRFHFPALPETSIANLWHIIVGDPALRKYLPDHWDKPKKADRGFCVDLLCTFYPDYMKDLVADARRQREAQKEARIAQAAEITITREFLLGLFKAPTINSKLPLLFCF